MWVPLLTCLWVLLSGVGLAALLRRRRGSVEIWEVEQALYPMAACLNPNCLHPHGWHERTWPWGQVCHGKLSQHGHHVVPCYCNRFTRKPTW